MMKNKKKKIQLYLDGACGNQFFQYAFARRIQEEVGGDLILNYFYVKRDQNVWQGSDNLLADFNTVDYKYENERRQKGRVFRLLEVYRRVFRYNTFSDRTYYFLLRLAKILPYAGIYYFDSSYYTFPMVKRNNIVIKGYFESPKYFGIIDDKIKQELLPKHPLLQQNEELFDKITSTNSVCITIKRQDIENPNISDIYKYDISYFYAGIDYIKEHVDNPVFFVFGDDLEWCRKNVKIDGEYYFETDNNPIWEKIRLMSSCKHFIIHNSTFSWWAQHLSKSQDKIVLAPVKWMLRDDQPIDLYEDNWLYITPDGRITNTHE